MHVKYTARGYGYPAPPGEHDETAPRLVARCGGPAACGSCASEAGWGTGMAPGCGYLSPDPQQLEALNRDDR